MSVFYKKSLNTPDFLNSFRVSLKFYQIFHMNFFNKSQINH